MDDSIRCYTRGEGETWDADESGPVRVGQTHVPLMLEWQRESMGKCVIDERGFELYGPLTIQNLTNDDINRALDPRHKRMVKGLVSVLGRTPTPLEVHREVIRADIFRQIRFDEYNPVFWRDEIAPQNELRESRRGDFPARENALEAFAKGEARLECDLTSHHEHLIITVPNAEGRPIDHHVMTEAERDWVERSGVVMARAAGAQGKTFTAGLGQAILTGELREGGVPLRNQVVAELNHGVIELVGRRLSEEFPDDQLDLRQGDFMSVLREAVARGERFKAIMIDAFPNTKDEVNRDGSNAKVLKLAYEALEPGGVLTCYPDSRYLPARMLTILTEMGIPEAAIHYTVAEFRGDSVFIDQYHHAEERERLMGVISIRKPLEEDADRITAMTDRYYAATSTLQ